MKILIATLLSFTSALSAYSLYLKNDTRVQMRVVVEGADGVQLAEMIIRPAYSYKWVDSTNYYGHFGKGSIDREQSTVSQIPFKVTWYCMNGNRYSYCENVMPEHTVTPRSCLKDTRCYPEEAEPGPYPNEPEGQDLYREPKPEKSQS